MLHSRQHAGNCRPIMRRIIFTAALAALGAMACRDTTAPTTILTESGSADFEAVVIKITHESFFSPAGYVSQYDVWVAIAPSNHADAGLVLGASTPVFISNDGVLVRATGESIRFGDSVQVWRDSSVGYGAEQAPPDSPCYHATQVLILR